MTEVEKREEGLKQIKAVADDGFAEINGRKYTFNKFTFVERRTVFGYMSSIEMRLKTKDLSFFDEPKFTEVERIINRNVTFDDGMTLSKKNVFEDYPEDYMMFIQTALMVISYPFLKGQLGE